MTVVKIQAHGNPDMVKTVTADHADRIFKMQNEKAIADASRWELVDNPEGKKEPKKKKTPPQ